MTLRYHCHHLQACHHAQGGQQGHAHAKLAVSELAAKNVNKAAKKHERASARYLKTILKRGSSNKLHRSARNTEKEPATVERVHVRGRIQGASRSRSSRAWKNGLDNEICSAPELILVSESPLRSFSGLEIVVEG
jgi:hypothetical protein